MARVGQLGGVGLVFLLQLSQVEITCGVVSLGRPGVGKLLLQTGHLHQNIEYHLLVQAEPPEGHR